MTKLLSVTDLAKRVIAVHPTRKLQTVRAAIKRDIQAGRLAAAKVGAQYTITEADAINWIAQRRKQD